MRRLTATLTVALAAIGVSGCFNQHEGPVTRAETEGIYVEVDGLQYQVQISRPLNPDDPEDSAYLGGITDPEQAVLERGENWFAVFVRVRNRDRDETRQSAEKFEIEDTTGQRFEPVEIDASLNTLAYEAGEVRPMGKIPEFNTPASDSATGGALLLFKIPGVNLENRPLEFLIEGRSGEALVDLDV